MFEELYLLDAAVFLANGAISFMYMEKFLRGRFDERRRAMLTWAALYAAAMLILSGVTTDLSPLDRFINVVPHFAALFLLQKKFFAQDLPRQIFTAASFVAAWEILRFTASPMAHAIFNVWSPLWAWLFNCAFEAAVAPADEIIFVMQAINRAATFIVIGLCRAVQLGILIFYLRTIAKRFTRRDYELKPHESLFLILPCATVLAIDLTMRLMAFSADNSAFMLIYERAPATILLLPIVSLLLLGMIVSSVILFQNLIQRKDEEQKRLLLENRVVEVHREVRELSEIYADIRGLRHDLRAHLENISAYVRENSGGDSQLENYIKNMNATVERLNFEDRTGNPITDIILHQIRQRARKIPAAFHADFHFLERFDVYDVSVILNNSLTNALEACEKLGGGEIQIRSYERGGLYFIEVENTFGGRLNWNLDSDIPATTKLEKNLHGIGLANIRRCAQKYLGDIDIETAAKTFRLTVMLYRKMDA